MNYQKTQTRGQLTIFASIKFEVREGHQNLIHSQLIDSKLLYRLYQNYLVISIA